MLCNGNSCLFFFLVRTMNFQWLSPFLSLDILFFFSVPTSFFAAVVISLRMDNGSSEQICTEKKKRDTKKNVLFEFSSRKTQKPRKKKSEAVFPYFRRSRVVVRFPLVFSSFFRFSPSSIRSKVYSYVASFRYFFVQLQ